MTDADLCPADILLYRVTDAVRGFRAIAIGEWALGIRPTYVHCSMIVETSPFRECSAYTFGFLDSKPGVLITGRYGPPCDVFRAREIVADCALAFLRSKLGTRYGWDGIAWLALVRRLGWRQIIDRPIVRPFCSSLVAEALQAGGVALPRYACEMAPSDLADVPGLVRVGSLAAVM